MLAVAIAALSLGSKGALLLGIGLGAVSLYLLYSAVHPIADAARKREGVTISRSGLHRLDWLALKWFLIIAGLPASIIGVVYLVLYLGAARDARRDGNALDLLLTSQEIHQVEFSSFERTNLLAGPAARKLVASLQKTNRIFHVDWTKQQVQTVRLLGGTNEIELSLGEDGTWQFREYGFRLRSQ
jgi:hypothetical protein